MLKKTKTNKAVDQTIMLTYILCFSWVSSTVNYVSACFVLITLFGLGVLFPHLQSLFANDSTKLNQHLSG